MKILLSIVGGLAALLIGGGWLTNYLQASDDPNVLATRGLHEHPRLEIYVKGEKIEIPQNIGVGTAYQKSPGYGNGGMAMTPMHTHDDVPVIHLEYQGEVRKDDLELGKFFEVWGRDISEFGENMRMTVNGEPNTEYEKYIMRDGDVIQLHYD